MRRTRRQVKKTMTSQKPADGQVLSRGVLHWLGRLSQAPARRGPTRTAFAARVRGLTDDVVKVKGTAKLKLASEVKEELGENWFERVELTGLETLTERGIRALAEGRIVD